MAFRRAWISPRFLAWASGLMLVSLIPWNKKHWNWVKVGMRRSLSAVVFLTPLPWNQVEMSTIQLKIRRNMLSGNLGLKIHKIQRVMQTQGQMRLTSMCVGKGKRVLEEPWGIQTFKVQVEKVMLIRETENSSAGRRSHSLSFRNSQEVWARTVVIKWWA